MLVKVRSYPVKNLLWNDIAEIEREIGSAFTNFFVGHETSEGKFTPAIDLVESGNDTLLLAELPGVQKEDVKITVEDNMLTISGSRKSNQLAEKSSWIRNEIRVGEFKRTIRLPKGTNTSSISAEITNGMLKVVLPKAEEVKAREIRIN